MVADALSYRRVLPTYLNNYRYHIVQRIPVRAISNNLEKSIEALRAAELMTLRDSNAAIKDLKHSRANWRAKVSVTVKTHKENSNVTMRIIHGCHLYPPQTLARWIGKQLRQYVTALDHVFSDTSEMLASIGRVPIDQPVMFLKYDVKDFFMSGAHYRLAKSLGNHIAETEGPLRRHARLIHDVVVFLLDSQYVSLDPKDPEADTLHVSHGSGMGMQCSAEIADLSFFQLVESQVVFSWLREQQYLLYGRCKDDALMIIPITPGISRRVNYLKTRLADYNGFVVDQWEASTVGVSFLDTFIFKNDHKRYVQYSTFWKPSAQQIRLDSSSGHAHKIHMSWKRSEIGRIARTCSTAELFNHSKRTFLERIAEQYEPTANMDELSELNPQTSKIAKLVLRQNTNDDSGPRPARKWLSLPYHPVW